MINPRPFHMGDGGGGCKERDNIIGLSPLFFDQDIIIHHGWLALCLVQDSCGTMKPEHA